MISSIQDLADGTALERRMLEWVSPRAPMSIPAGRIDLRQPGKIIIAATGHSIADGGRRDALAELRPLLFATAWKILDLMLEYALDSLASANQKRWSIENKSKHAQAFHGSLPGLTRNPDIWQRICLVYVSMVEARHSLIHRRLSVNARGDFVNLAGSHSTITVDEQNAIQGLALCSSAVALRQNCRSRDELVLSGYLNALAALHGCAALASSSEDRWTVVINSEVRSGRWALDAQSLLGQARAAASKSSHFDVEIHLVGSGLSSPILGALEAAALDGVKSFDPTVVEPWMNP
jgi:hypothetical protein